jgi:hypothetical protein
MPSGLRECKEMQEEDPVYWLLIHWVSHTLHEEKSSQGTCPNPTVTVWRL